MSLLASRQPPFRAAAKPRFRSTIVFTRTGPNCFPCKLAKKAGVSSVESLSTTISSHLWGVDVESRASTQSLRLFERLRVHTTTESVEAPCGLWGADVRTVSESLLCSSAPAIETLPARRH